MQQPQTLDDDDLRSICAREIEAAQNHMSTLSEVRKDALDAYLGKNNYPSKAGQSSVVTREVLETCEWILPQLLKVFVSSDEIVRFEPQGPEDVQYAEQATDFCNFIWNRQNPGFVNTHCWFKDALLSRLGCLKVWWLDDPKVTHHDLYGVSVNQIQLLIQDAQIEIANADPVDPPVIGPDGQPMQLFDVRLSRSRPDGHVCVECVPPEEYLFLPSCKAQGDPGQGQRTRKTQSDLIEMGYDPAVIDDLPTSDEDDENAEKSHRFEPSTLETVPRDSRDRASRYIELVEWYTKLDRDGDGIAEFLKVTLAGTNHSVLLDVEEVEQPPFAVLSPILMPHRKDGLSVADLIQDLQEIKTAITRQALNSLYLANKPRNWIVDGQVNLQDYLSHEAGGAVRVKAPGMIGELNTTFVAGQAFPMLEYIDRTLETRSGISKLAQGIDADVLRGGGAAAQTATGVAALQSAAAVRIELIARVFAETGVKHAFSLILKLVTQYQQQAKVIRLRNQWVEMNPADWDGEYDVSIEVGLGTGNKQEQLGTLAQIRTVQEALLQMGGLGLVTPLEYYHTLAQLVKIAGLKNVDQYFRDPSQQPPTPPQPPQQDPNMLMIQVQAQVEQGKLQLAVEKMKREDDLARDKLDADIALRSRELEMKYGAAVDMAGIKAAVDRDREAVKQQASLAQTGMQHAHEQQMQASAGQRVQPSDRLSPTQPQVQ
jgi:hypothetical protein